MTDVQKDGLDPGDDGVSVTVNNQATSVSTGDVSTVPTDQSSTTVGMSFGTRAVPLAEKEKWFKTYWRPAAAWIYLFINLFDFVAAPVMSMLLPKFLGTPYSPWTSLTLSNGGMFHLAFGAIIGVTAWGRTRERVAGVGPADNG